jgi:hypothetical protein
MEGWSRRISPAANLPSIDGTGGSTPSVIGRNGVDLFCGSELTSLGSANLAGAAFDSMRECARGRSRFAVVALLADDREQAARERQKPDV